VIHRAEVTETGNVLAAGELISTTSQASAAISAWFLYRFRDGLIPEAIVRVPRARGTIAIREQSHCTVG
jgi:hypothetical protein